MTRQEQMRRTMVFNDGGFVLTRKDVSGYPRNKEIGDGYTPTLGANGYYYLNLGAFGCRPVLLHHAIWVYHHGEVPAGHHVDHIDGDPLNNDLGNLRCVPAKVNARNCRLSKNNTSGVNGVAQKATGKWTARITVDRRDIHLGTFSTLADAAAARKAADARYGFAERHGDVR